MIRKSQIRFPRPTNHAAPALCHNRSQDDPKAPFHRLRLHSSSKECIIHWAPPPPPPRSVITYHTHLCCFVFATTFFLNFAFHFPGKKIVPPFRRLATPLSLYIQANIPTRRVKNDGIFLNLIINFLESTQDLFQTPIVLDDVINYFFQTVFLQYSITFLSYENARHRWHFVFAAFLCYVTFSDTCISLRIFI